MAARIHPRHRWKAAVLAGSAILVAGPWLWVSIATSASVRPAADGGFAPADAALILGAGVREDGSPSPFLRERVAIGVRLYEQGTVSTLIMSGDGDDSSGYGEPTVMREVAESMGIPPADIIEDPQGLDTRASCSRAHDTYGAQSVIVATQRFHQARAVWLCAQEGMDAQGAYPPPTPTRKTLMGNVREVAAIPAEIAESRGWWPAGS